MLLGVTMDNSLAIQKCCNTTKLPERLRYFTKFEQKMVLLRALFNSNFDDCPQKLFQIVES